MSTHEQRTGVLTLPAIVDMAKHYELDAAAFVYTFKTIAMPANSSDAEFVSCCLVAREHGLNPLTKEIYFMKTRGGAIQPIVSVDGWLKKCNEHPQFDGMDFEDDRDAQGNLLGMWCTIHRKDRKHPTRIREDFKECAAVGGAVWKTNPSRMMRNRVICQCARIAFGFAGIMEPDEFAAWNGGMKDVTPVTAQISPPDIPDDIPETPVDQTPDTPDDVDPDIADEAGFLDKLMADYSACDSDEEVAELKADSKSLIKRLSPAGRKRARAIFEGNE